MATKKIIWAGIAGGIAFFLLGWLFYGILLAGFFEANAGTATGVYREMDDMIMWAIFVGNLFTGFLLAIIMGSWSKVTTPLAGAKVGAIVGLLMTAGFDFTMYGASNLMTMTGGIGDIITMGVMSAIAGLVVAWVLGMGKKKEETT